MQNRCRVAKLIVDTFMEPGVEQGLSKGRPKDSRGRKDCRMDKLNSLAVSNHERENGDLSLTPPCEKVSVYEESEQEALRYKWIESEKAGHDLGEAALRHWVKEHWCGYLRSRWLEHLQGKRFWVELDRGDFGLLQREFHNNTLLLDRILDRLKAGKENLDILLWCHEWGIPVEPTINILEALDINSRRLAHRFDPQF